MVLEGVVTNVAAFGAFVDIGVHQDGLVHISAMSKNFVKDPREVAKPGDVVKVKVLEVDVAAQAHRPDHATRRCVRRRVRRPTAGRRQRRNAGAQDGAGGQASAKRLRRSFAAGRRFRRGFRPRPEMRRATGRRDDKAAFSFRPHIQHIARYLGRTG